MTIAEAIRREARIKVSRLNFWQFCKTLAPDFYKEDRPHLRIITETLQALYEGRIVKYAQDEPWQVIPFGQQPAPGVIVCKKLMLNVPPQHGKTRSLVNFANWVFGVNTQEKIITGSYNDETAGDFSKYTRDGIEEQQTISNDIVYREIFPNTRVKRGSRSYAKWALEGSHFSYLGAGIGGSITSKGGTILIIDDPIKGAEEAMNENNLERTWLWYTSTFLSRVAAKHGEPIEIICMTRWSKGDPCGRLLDDKEEAKKWYILKMKAYDPETDTMLCPEMFSKTRYLDNKRKMAPAIFEANYNQEAIEVKGAMFGNVKRFSMDDIKQQKQQAAVIGYIDVADQGDDNLCFVVGHVFPGKVFITDVIFTGDPVDITIPRCAGLIRDRNVSWTRVETNNQGGMFKRDLERHIKKQQLLGVVNTTNKHTRILMEEGAIKEHFYFLVDEEQSEEYAAYFKQVTGYMRKKEMNKHDDAPDATSGLSLFVKSYLGHMFPTEIELEEKRARKERIEKGEEEPDEDEDFLTEY